MKTSKKKPEVILPEAARKAAFPGFIEPMKAKLMDKIFSDKNWVYELKWDGYRALAYIRKGEIELISRNARVFTSYGKLNKELSKIKFDAVIDGEIAALNKEGRPSFQLLQNYERRPDSPLVFYAFDLLYYEGFDLMKAPLLERKRVLKEVLPEIPHMVFSEHYPRIGEEMFQFAIKQGLEGVIGKRADSIYEAGKRSGNWIKVKIQKTQEAIIVGYTEPKGSRKYFGTLLLAVNDKDKLHFIGGSGGGFSESELERIKGQMSHLEQEEPIFKKLPGYSLKDIHWVKPELVCEIAFTEWTDEGTMRHPVFKGMRPDKRPEEVIIEQ